MQYVMIHSSCEQLHRMIAAEKWIRWGILVVALLFTLKFKYKYYVFFARLETCVLNIVCVTRKSFEQISLWKSGVSESAATK